MPEGTVKWLQNRYSKVTSSLLLEEELAVVNQRTASTGALNTISERNLFLRGAKQDVTNAFKQLNSVHLNLARNLLDEVGLRALDYGLSGNILITDIDAAEGSSSAYWSTALGRQRSIKETIDVILGQLGGLGSSGDAFDDTEILADLQQLVADTFGGDYDLDGDGNADLLYSLAQHIDELGAFYTGFPGTGVTHTTVYPGLTLAAPATLQSAYDDGTGEINTVVDKDIVIFGDAGLNLQASGGFSQSVGAFGVDTTGAVTINSDLAIGIGTAADNQNINIGTAGNRAITVGGYSGTESLSLYAGTGAVAVYSAAGVDIEAASSMLLDAGTYFRARAEEGFVLNPAVNGPASAGSQQVEIENGGLRLYEGYAGTNSGYTTVAAKTGGVVVNYLPTAVSSSVNTGGFVAGVDGVSDPTVTVLSSAGFTVGDFIQIVGSVTFNNRGLYEVASIASNTLSVRSTAFGITDQQSDFTKNQFITNTATQPSCTVQKVNVSVLRAGTDGAWEWGIGSTSPITFEDLLASGTTDAVDLSSASSVSVPTPTSGSHAATKQYVDENAYDVFVYDPYAVASQNIYTTLTDLLAAMAAVPTERLKIVYFSDGVTFPVAVYNFTNTYFVGDRFYGSTLVFSDGATITNGTFPREIDNVIIQYQSNTQALCTGASLNTNLVMRDARLIVTGGTQPIYSRTSTGGGGTINMHGHSRLEGVSGASVYNQNSSQTLVVNMYDTSQVNDYAFGGSTGTIRINISPSTDGEWSATTTAYNNSYANRGGGTTSKQFMGRAEYLSAKKRDGTTAAAGSVLISNGTNTELVASAAQTLVDGANIAWDAGDSFSAQVTLGGNRTLDDPTNGVSGHRYTLKVSQDGTGGHTLAFASAYKFAGGAAPTITATASAYDVLEFWFDGTNFNCVGTFQAMA